MNKLLKVLKQKNITCGYLYFYIHLITEIACFFFLTTVTNNSNFVWLIPFIYDGLAFVPQSIIGNFNDKYKSINLTFIGLIFFIIAYLGNFILGKTLYLWLILLCLGNALIHIGGAETTLRVSNGNLSHSAIFVSGGSFGVIIGKLLAKTKFIVWWEILILILTMIPYIFLARTYKAENYNCENFKYVNKNINPMLVIFIAFFIVIIRGYMGYGIPTSWNKTVMQSIILYFTMGIGKALGGILSDAYGIRKIGIISTTLSIPFLCLGNKFMLISLIGVMIFSMTMAITLAILVSKLPNKPGLAFGITTIGLFLGTTPIFFIKLSYLTNIIFIIVMSLICTLLLSKILVKENQ